MPEPLLLNVEGLEHAFGNNVFDTYETRVGLVGVVYDALAVQSSFNYCEFT
jgi:hypothetical protein